MNGVNYDNWLNSTNPYDKDYELEEERAYHLDKIKDMDEELEEHLEKMREMDNIDDQKDYCDDHHLKYGDIEAYLWAFLRGRADVLGCGERYN